MRTEPDTIYGETKTLSRKRETLRPSPETDGILPAYVLLGVLILIQFDVGGVRIFASDLLAPLLALSSFRHQQNPLRDSQFVLSLLAFFASLTFGLQIYLNRFGELPSAGVLFGRWLAPALLIPYLILLAGKQTAKLKSIFLGVVCTSTLTLAFFVPSIFGVNVGPEVASSNRLTSFMSDPNAYGITCATAILFLFLHRDRRQSASLTVMIACLILTLSRSGWLALFIGFFVCIFLSAKYRQEVKRIAVTRRATQLAVSMLLLGIVLISTGIWSDYVVPQMAERPDTASSRLDSASRALAEFNSGPFLGGGLGSTRLEGGALADSIVHSTFAWILGELGVVGIATGFFFLVLPALLHLRRATEAGAAAASIVVVQFVGSFGIDGLGQRLWWVGLGAVWCYLRSPSMSRVTDRTTERARTDP